MKLTIYQKSLYRLLINATMILRSIGKTYKKDSNKLKHFKQELFKEIEKLVELIDKKKLKNENVLKSIQSLASKCQISIGQSQKCINVILKYHYYLNDYNREIIRELDCPLDSIILKKIGFQKIKLCNLNLKEYKCFQLKISNLVGKKEFKIDFDKEWDKQNLEKDGLL